MSPVRHVDCWPRSGHCFGVLRRSGAKTAQLRTGRYWLRAARVPLALTAPAATASAHAIRPVASRSHVSGSVSTTFGGVPRVCRGPATACTATNGGTRNSTDRPGCCAAKISASARVVVASAARSIPTGARPGNDRDRSSACTTSSITRVVRKSATVVGPRGVSITLGSRAASAASSAAAACSSRARRSSGVRSPVSSKVDALICSISRRYRRTNSCGGNGGRSVGRCSRRSSPAWTRSR